MGKWGEKGGKEKGENKDHYPKRTGHKPQGSDGWAMVGGWVNSRNVGTPNQDPLSHIRRGDRVNGK